MTSTQTPGKPPGQTPRPAGTVYRGKPVGRRLNGKLVALISAGVVVLLLLGGYVGFNVYTGSLDKNLTRVSLGNRRGEPAKVVTGARNILIIGSDNADDTRGNQGVYGQRSDSLIVLHIPASHDKAYLISIPRDSYVFVPSNGKGLGGYKAKINSAYSWGGIPLTFKTVEGFTGLHLDNVIQIGFNGFKGMTDAVGGVDVYVEKTTKDPRSHRTFRKGWNHLDGAAALDYVRQRYGLPAGDFDRVKRQQIFLKALLKKATSAGIVTDLGKLDAFLRATAKSLTVDDGFSLRDMAWQFRNLRPDDLAFLTTPNLGSQNINGNSVVAIDKPYAAALFEAVTQDKLAAYIAAHPPNNADKGH
jgi:LCP family protein required for cell wall assembly